MLARSGVGMGATNAARDAGDEGQGPGYRDPVSGRFNWTHVLALT